MYCRLFSYPRFYVWMLENGIYLRESWYTYLRQTDGTQRSREQTHERENVFLNKSQQTMNIQDWTRLSHSSCQPVSHDPFGGWMTLSQGFITITKLQLGSSNRNSLWLRVTTKRGIILKVTILGRLRTTGLAKTHGHSTDSGLLNRSINLSPQMSLWHYLPQDFPYSLKVWTHTEISFEDHFCFLGFLQVFIHSVLPSC